MTIKITRLEDTRLRANAVRVNAPFGSKVIQFRTEFKLYEWVRRFTEKHSNDSVIFND